MLDVFNAWSYFTSLLDRKISTCLATRKITGHSKTGISRLQVIIGQESLLYKTGYRHLALTFGKKVDIEKTIGIDIFMENTPQLALRSICTVLHPDVHLSPILLYAILWHFIHLRLANIHKTCKRTFLRVLKNYLKGLTMK
ncbi:hypothetical protein SNE40_018939 [Patella caerulea]|uniref:Uncharacterized protein n=1 Tax=Patella caerulea TaxID=87958 RepID=A0AAN8P4V8_PATCE